MKKNLLLLFVFFTFCSSIAQRFVEYEPLVKRTDSSLIKEEQGRVWTELTNERTLYSSHFKDEKGNTKGVFSKKPIHYLDKNGDLQVIKPGLSPSTNGWSANQQAYPTHLNSDGTYTISLDVNGSSFLLGKNRQYNGTPMPKVMLRHGDVKSTGCEIRQGNYTQQLIFSEDRVKSNVLVNAPVTLNDPNYFIVEETVVLPDGYELRYESLKVYEMEEITVRGSRGGLFIDGLAYGADIIIVNRATQKPCGKIFAPFAYDASMNYQQGSISYKQIGESNEYRLTIGIAASWFNATERVYPITIDPLVGGPTATWAGGYMNSCLTPTYNVDSLQATIPAGVTPTGVYVSSSFYADPWTGATMNQGVMYFSTICGNSQTFTITGANAQSAGTAYLDSFNMMSPLVCCIPEACTATNFYVRFHLSRYTYGAGCNITYIRYDPFTTLWPFQVVVYGRTPESYGSVWYATQTPLCSNNCSVEVRAYARYGVAPYTFTHPWTNDTVVTGTNSGCGAGSTNHLFSLNIPNCPVYCDSSYTLLNIPPPVITDACGAVIAGIPFETVPIKPATNIELTYDSVVCSGTNNLIELSSCFSNGTAYYFGNNTNGQGNFNFNEVNAGAPNTVTFSAYAEGDGCTSDTTTFSVTVHSNPQANYSVTPAPVLVGIPTSFQDQSVSPASTINQWSWILNGSMVSMNNSWNNTFNAPSSNVLCLAVEDAMGCVDTLCGPLMVVPAEVSIPNIITPNNDQVNDLLAFEYLDFYPANHLKILNRWGNVVFEQEGYANTWDGADLSDGVYFFVLTLTEKNQTYSGFFHISR